MTECIHAYNPYGVYREELGASTVYTRMHLNYVEYVSANEPYGRSASLLKRWKQNLVVYCNAFELGRDSNAGAISCEGHGRQRI